MLSTNNTAWGFWGTIAQHAEASEALPLALEAIVRATEFSEEVARDFLDSRHGRHFADDAAQRLFEGLPLRSAIKAVAERWMNWSTSASRLSTSARWKH